MDRISHTVNPIQIRYMKADFQKRLLGLELGLGFGLSGMRKIPFFLPTRGHSRYRRAPDQLP